MSRGTLDYMFQKSVVQLESLLNVACKVVDNTGVILLGDRLNLLRYGFFQCRNSMSSCPGNVVVEELPEEEMRCQFYFRLTVDKTFPKSFAKLCHGKFSRVRRSNILLGLQFLVMKFLMLKDGTGTLFSYGHWFTPIIFWEKLVKWCHALRQRPMPFNFWMVRVFNGSCFYKIPEDNIIIQQELGFIWKPDIIQVYRIIVDLLRKQLTLG